MDARNPRYVFVYGTLRRDAGHSMHRVLADGARLLEQARWQARLYEMVGYPAAVPSDEPTDVVHGELYALTQPSRVLLDLDDYEGEAFRRERVTVRTAGGERVEAWAYVWTGEVDERRRVASGDWVLG